MLVFENHGNDGSEVNFIVLQGVKFDSRHICTKLPPGGIDIVCQSLIEVRGVTFVDYQLFEVGR